MFHVSPKEDRAASYSLFEATEHEFALNPSGRLDCLATHFIEVVNSLAGIVRRRCLAMKERRKDVINAQCESDEVSQFARSVIVENDLRV